jgi:hypothetical protein
MSRYSIKLLAVCIITAGILFFLWNIKKKDLPQIEQKPYTASIKSEDEMSKTSTVEKSLEKIKPKQYRQVKEKEPNQNINEGPRLQTAEEQKVNVPNNNNTNTPQSLSEDFDKFEEKTVTELWDEWQIALALGDKRSSSQIREALEIKLRNDPDINVLNSLKGVLESTEVPNDEKILVVDLLQRTATPDTLYILIESAKKPDIHQKDHKTILAGIANFGKYGWKDTFHEELSPILEEEWIYSSELGNSYKAAIANAIASVGSERGVTLLINSLSSDSDKVDRQTKIIIGKAFSRIKNPAAIKPLSEILFNESNYGNSIWQVSGDTLSNMEHPDATRTLLNWAQTSDSEDLIWVERWFGKVRDPRSIEIMEDSIIRDTYQNNDVYFTIKNIVNEKLK